MKENYEIVGNIHESFEDSKEAYIHLYRKVCEMGAVAIVMVDSVANSSVHGNVQTKHNILTGKKSKERSNPRRAI